MNILALILRGIRRIIRNIKSIFDYGILHFNLFINGVKYVSIHSNGQPYFCVSPTGKCIIGKNMHMNNGLRFNPIGYPQPCTIYVANNACLTIGDNLGISQASIICHDEIIIGNNVKIGGGSKIYDTDFHSLSSQDRRDFDLDMKNKKKAKVIIGNDVLIGAGCIILKGIEIGDNSIVGAGSIVTKNIPANQIWGGNPAKFLRYV